MIYILYLIIVFVILFFIYLQWQKSVVFHPRYYRDMSLYDKSYTFLTVHNGNITLEGCVYEPEEAKKTILYFGGRGQDSVGLLPKLAEQLPSLRIVTFNYRGYGKSEGIPSEKSLLDDAVLITKKVQNRYEDINVVGYSLGGAIASYATLHVKEIRSLVLVGTFCSLDSLVKEKYKITLPFLQYHFFTCNFLEGIFVPVSILISKDDNMIPYSESKRLQRYVQNLLVYREVKHYNHVELLWSKEFFELL